MKVEESEKKYEQKEETMMRDMSQQKDEAKPKMV